MSRDVSDQLPAGRTGEDRRQKPAQLQFSETMMKLGITAATAGAIAATLWTIAPAPVRAHEYPWCAQYGGGMDGSRNCGFVTFRQCLATASGNGGVCVRNQFFHGGDRRFGPPYAE